MSLSGIVPCFLCKASIYYEKSDKSMLLSHMNSEHNAFFGNEFLLAGCIMNDDERMAIVNVVKDREPSYLQQPSAEEPQTDAEDVTLENNELIIENDDDDENELYITALTPETTLQEIDTTVEVTPHTEEEDQGVSPPRMNEKLPIEFPCPECPLTFNLKIRLNRHVKLHDKRDKVISEMAEAKKEVIKAKKVVVKKELGSKTKQGARVWTPAEGEKGVPCSECGKLFKSRGPMLRHFEDIHQSGEYPCKGCGKMFSSKNKMSSHFSRHCNPLNPNGSRRKTVG